MSLIKIEASDKCFSIYGGMPIAQALLRKSGVLSGLKKIFPKPLRNGNSAVWKSENLILGFQAGAEHLEDWDQLSTDGAFSAVQDQAYTSKSLGNFLRSAGEYELRQMQHLLIETSLKLRRQTLGEKSDDMFILDLDSTHHHQYGKKTEGVEYCYKKFPALDTIMAYDELGFQYWHQVRPGSTFTSNGSSEIIHTIFSRLPHSPQQRKIVRADSGFANSEFFNSCSAKGVGFVCAMRQLPSVMQAVYRIKNWHSQNLSNQHRVLAKDGRECEIGTCSFHIEKSVKPIRLVVIRAAIEPDKNCLFPDHILYDYWTFATNMGQHEYSHEDLLHLYRGRGNAENFIKEAKYGFDLKHYPCLKLNANRAFGLFAAYAYTLMRFLSLHKPSEKRNSEGKIRKVFHFAKKLRRDFLWIPVQLLRHAGSISFRFNHQHYREVHTWLCDLKKMQFGYS